MKSRHFLLSKPPIDFCNSCGSEAVLRLLLGATVSYFIVITGQFCFEDRSLYGIKMTVETSSFVLTLKMRIQKTSYLP